MITQLHGGARCHQQDCRDWFTEHGDTDFDYVFHLAAMVGGRAMIENKPLAVADDLSIDAEYWQWAERTHPARTACFSSSAAYPVKYQRETGYQLLSESWADLCDEPDAAEPVRTASALTSSTRI